MFISADWIEVVLLFTASKKLNTTNNLAVDKEDNISGYMLRTPFPKRKVEQALQSLDYIVIAFGDSCSEVSMLKQAEIGILFCLLVGKTK